MSNWTRGIVTYIDLIEVKDSAMAPDGRATDVTILIDCNIRAAADDPDDDTPDVATKLRKRLQRDSAGRRYVDAFLLSRPDRDHCARLRNHFHLGPL